MSSVSGKLRRNFNTVTQSLLLKPSTLDSPTTEESLTSLKSGLLKSEDYAFLKELDEHLLDDEDDLTTTRFTRKTLMLRRCFGCCKIFLLNKAAVSLWFTLFLMFVSLLLFISEKSLALEGNNSRQANSTLLSLHIASKYLFHMGLLGFVSGLTNLLANLFLFYGIPVIPGCAVIQRRHKEIRWIIKEVVVNLLCDSEFLERYISQELQKASTNIKIEESITAAVNSREVELLVIAELSQIYTEPEGHFLREMGLERDVLYSLAKPFVLMLCAEAAPVVIQELSESQQTISSMQLRGEMDKFLSWRMENLTKKKIRKVLFNLIFRQLDWIIVWGCLMGVIFGVILKSVGI